MPGETIGELQRRRARNEATDFLAVGTAATVADRMQDWIAGTGVHGFNLHTELSYRSLYDFADLLMPELRRRGLTQAPSWAHPCVAGAWP